MLYRLALALLLSGGIVAAPIVELASPAMAASKKTTKKKSELTPAQKKKIQEYAKALCEKKYGKSARVYRIDYFKKTVWCRTPGY
jgi:hypothetical protein